MQILCTDIYQWPSLTWNANELWASGASKVLSVCFGSRFCLHSFNIHFTNLSSSLRRMHCLIKLCNPVSRQLMTSQLATMPMNNYYGTWKYTWFQRALLVNTNWSIITFPARCACNDLFRVQWHFISITLILPTTPSAFYYLLNLNNHPILTRKLLLEINNMIAFGYYNFYVPPIYYYTLATPSSTPEPQPNHLHSSLIKFLGDTSIPHFISSSCPGPARRCG